MHNEEVSRFTQKKGSYYSIVIDVKICRNEYEQVCYSGYSFFIVLRRARNRARIPQIIRKPF